jgi:SAM-dependent methyltransferase
MVAQGDVLQRDYFKKPFVGNFKWRTENPYVSVKESNLLADIAECIKCLPTEALVLEVACGEGPNIALLRKRGITQKIYGIDLSQERIAFCCRNVKDFTGVTMSAIKLAFKDEMFDLVFFRDLLHHVGNVKRTTITESLRVLKKGGVLYFLEANGRNPGFFLQAIALRAERGLLSSSKKNIVELASQFGRYELSMYEPSNFFRVFFHYSVGFPTLARYRFFALLSDTVTKIAEKIIPQNLWAYICMKIVK